MQKKNNIKRIKSFKKDARLYQRVPKLSVSNVMGTPKYYKKVGVKYSVYLHLNLFFRR